MVSFVIIQYDTSYESPCGVMRIYNERTNGQRQMLRIPMRGYENRNASACAADAWLRIPMRGYEILQWGF